MSADPRERKARERNAVLTGVALLVLLAPATAHAGGGPQTFTGPTNSSPITLSRDGRLLWVVNPQGDSVSVINTKTNAPIKSIKVGDEPQSVAVDPVNKYAYVANAASGNVSAIKITDPRPGSFRAALDKKLVKPSGQITTGSEPWNIVSSPDGKRVFVANSSQDTITVIDAVACPSPVASWAPSSTARSSISWPGRVDLAPLSCATPCPGACAQRPTRRAGMLASLALPRLPSPRGQLAEAGRSKALQETIRGGRS